MENWSVEELVRSLHDENDSIRLRSVKELAIIASSANDCNLFIKSPHRFLNTLRKILDCEKNTNIIDAILELIQYSLPLFNSNHFEYFYDLVLPSLVQLLPISDEFPENSVVETLRSYAKHAKDAKGILETLVEVGIRHNDSRVREKSSLCIKLIDTMITSNTPIDFCVALPALVDLLGDVDASVVVASQEVLGWVRGKYEDNSFEKAARKLSPRQRLLLHDHFEYITRFENEGIDNQNKIAAIKKSSEKKNSSIIPQHYIRLLEDESSTFEIKKSTISKIFYIFDDSHSLNISTKELKKLISIARIFMEDDDKKNLVDLGMKLIKKLVDKSRAKIQSLLSIIVPILSEKLGSYDQHIRNKASIIFSSLFSIMSNASLFLSLRGTFENCIWRVRDEGIRIFIQGLIQRPEQKVNLDFVLPDVIELLMDPDSNEVRKSVRELCVFLQHLSPGANILDLIIDRGISPNDKNFDELRQRLQHMNKRAWINENGKVEYPLIGRKLDQFQKEETEQYQNDPLIENQNLLYDSHSMYKKTNQHENNTNKSPDQFFSENRKKASEFVHFRNRNKEKEMADNSWLENKVSEMSIEDKNEDYEPKKEIATRLTALKQRRNRKSQRKSISANANLEEFRSGTVSPKRVHKSSFSSPMTPQELGSYDLHGTRKHEIKSSVPIPEKKIVNPDDRPIKPMKQMTLDEYGFDEASTSSPKGRLFDGYENENEKHNEEMTNNKKTDNIRFVSKVTQRRMERKQKMLQQNKALPSEEKYIEDNNNDTESISSYSKSNSVSKSIVYLKKEELKPFNDAKKIIHKLSSQFKSTNWEQNFEALTNIRRLTLNHSDLFAPKCLMYMKDILKQVNNLRSTVAKNAILVVQSICEDLKRIVEPVLDDILSIILKKSADTNAFISQSADEAIEAMVNNLHPGRILTSVLPIIHDTKSALIRYSSGKAMYLCVQKLDKKFSSYKDSDKVLKCVGNLLMDSSVDVRTSAKATVYHLIHQQIVDVNRMNRCMPQSAYEKLQQIVNDNECVSTLSKTNNSFHITSSSGARRKIKKSNHCKKDFSSINNDSNNSFIDETKFLLLKKKIESSNWRERHDVIDEIKIILLNNTSTKSLMKAKYIIPIFDELSKRLEDGNVKVNLCALMAFEEIVPLYGNNLEPVLSTILPAITGNLSSSNRHIAYKSKDILDLLCDEMNGKYLCQPIVEIIRYGNLRAKPILIQCLTKHIEDIYFDKPILITKHIIPLSFSLLREIKNEVKQANYQLIKTIDSVIDFSLIHRYHDKLSNTDQDRIRQIIGHD